VSRDWECTGSGNKFGTRITSCKSGNVVLAVFVTAAYVVISGVDTVIVRLIGHVVLVK